MNAPINRLERRKARTRSALIGAAQSLIAAGNPNVPVSEITQAADVGMGSFYNHFESKEQLFAAAVDNALEALGSYLDILTAGLDDPAEMFAQSFRLTGRLFRLQPEMSRVLVNSWTGLMASDRGLAPRALRDIRAGVDAGRFTVDDPDLALAMVTGSLLGLGQLLLQNPDRDDVAAVDRVALDLLRVLGVPESEADVLCRRPVPELDQLVKRDP
nr:TetR/AcrR family transcriptional regulator [Rhodococcus sp. (in: high G+C Gram-positive bacteria)]